jgi:hypothetical protein
VPLKFINRIEALHAGCLRQSCGCRNHAPTQDSGSPGLHQRGRLGEMACVREGQRPLAVSDNDRGIVERGGAAREFQNQTHL